MSRRARTAAFVALLLLSAGAGFELKRFSAGASAADLRPLLAPTAWLVEAAGGHRFDWTAGGYLSAEARFLVAPACAGVNFLLAAFGALVLGLLRPWRPAWQNACLLAASAAAACLATLFANALRILVAISLWAHGATLGGIGGARLRELAGAVVFLGTLLAVYLAARRLARAPLDPWVPLLPYAGLTLLVPLLRGAGGRPEFWAHAAVVGCALGAAAVAGALLRRWLAPGIRARRAQRGGASLAGPGGPPAGAP